ncbi:GD20602 [Drosophila simulans]|uniref:GD20602 n=1 Tax=Drosophila simulans TaxID=7240 RepID=B4QT12_DROSI|nr:GD20602 [Drosophila simulans]
MYFIFAGAQCAERITGEPEIWRQDRWRESRNPIPLGQDIRQQLLWRRVPRFCRQQTTMDHKRIKVMANKTELTLQARDGSRPRSHTCDLASHNMFELKPHFEPRLSSAQAPPHDQ